MTRGWRRLFDAARRNNYRARLNYSDYVVFIARADRTRDSTGAYSPDMAFAAGGYAGSVYERGGQIYAAGMVSSYSPAALVVAEHERDWQRMTNVVRYEGEHLILYHNDRRRFNQTADHTRGGAHPRRDRGKGQGEKGRVGSKTGPPFPFPTFSVPT